MLVNASARMEFNNTLTAAIAPRGKNNKGSEMENQMDELYKEIGKLKVENEFLKQACL